LVVSSAACSPRLYSAGGGADDVAWTAPENGWPSQAPPEDLEGQGFEPGMISLDIRGTDQHGATVSSWQFYGLTVLVDVSTMWCAPCRELGMHAEDVYQAWKDRGFMHLTVLHEDIDNGDVDGEELNLWAGLPASGDSSYDLITAPIIADNKGVSGSIKAIKANQYPAVLLIGPDLEVLERLDPPVTEELIDGLLERYLE
jgi:thiol-disulfide isomerase/thioredoxin